MDRVEVVQVVSTCLRDVLSDEEGAAPEQVDESTQLIGLSSVLDSLGLVQLIVDVEQRLQSEHGISVTLADERAMSQKHSPFRTVSTLADYICVLLEDEYAHARP